MTRDEEARIDVGLYLRQGLVVRAYTGHSPCRLCSLTRNGSLELSDGTYVGPKGSPTTSSTTGCASRGTSWTTSRRLKR